MIFAIFDTLYMAHEVPAPPWKPPFYGIFVLEHANPPLNTSIPSSLCTTTLVLDMPHWLYKFGLLYLTLTL